MLADRVQSARPHDIFVWMRVRAGEAITKRARGTVKDAAPASRTIERPAGACVQRRFALQARLVSQGLAGCPAYAARVLVLVLCLAQAN